MTAGAVVGLLDTLTFPELITILVIGLVVLGPEKLPGIARQAGQWMAKVRSMTSNLQQEVREVLDDPEMQSLRELGEFAANPRSKIAEYARTAALDGGDDDDPPEGSRVGEQEPESAVAVPATVGESADAEDDGSTAKVVAVGPDHPMGAVTAIEADEVPSVTPEVEPGNVDAG